ncbi:methyltransferase [Halarcobacter ebronensis]|uniref:Methyltransferase n=1 Tax=Halarcobacter ebronensis TaxID=1462615 RepID=A0A4Q0YDH6_9BACT|nr:methyltransferase domain-containing protein [Halarcobacter ebronensis]RXJ68143.1 methyltransferase [Halarcobacter ebronensis]
MKRFTTEDIYQIYLYLKKELNSKKSASIEVLNPAFVKPHYSGEFVNLDTLEYRYRNYRVWSDLAQKLFCRISEIKELSKHTILIGFEKLDDKDSFHKTENNQEKYGSSSIFNRIDKNEEPEILLSYLEALNSVDLKKRKRVLNLGVNSADEFKIIKKYFDTFCQIEFVGIDYCVSAINEAKEYFIEDKNCTFYAQDINSLDELNLGEFDLIISIGTFQSSNLEFNTLFMHIVQNYLKKDGAMILGFPNCRWVDGEIVYGARVPNYNYSELSTLFKDAVFCKKYLQQKKFRVTLTGKYYIFLTATSIKK